MNKLQTISTALVAGVATFIAGGEVRQRLTATDNSRTSQIFREVDTNQNGEIEIGEALQSIDISKKGHPSEIDIKRGEETRDFLSARGNAMLKSAASYDKAVKVLKGEQ